MRQLTVVCPEAFVWFCTETYPLCYYAQHQSGCMLSTITPLSLPPPPPTSQLIFFWLRKEVGASILCMLSFSFLLLTYT